MLLPYTTFLVLLLSSPDFISSHPLPDPSSLTPPIQRRRLLSSSLRRGVSPSTGPPSPGAHLARLHALAEAHAAEALLRRANVPGHDAQGFDDGSWRGSNGNYGKVSPDAAYVAPQQTVSMPGSSLAYYRAQQAAVAASALLADGASSSLVEGAAAGDYTIDPSYDGSKDSSTPSPPPPTGSTATSPFNTAKPHTAVDSGALVPSTPPSSDSTSPLLPSSKDGSTPSLVSTPSAGGDTTTSDASSGTPPSGAAIAGVGLAATGAQSMAHAPSTGVISGDSTS